MNSRDIALIAAVLAAYLATSRGFSVGDNLVHLDTAVGIAQRGSPALSYDPGLGFSRVGRGGDRYSLLGPGLAVIAAPIVWVAGHLTNNPTLPNQLQAASTSGPDYADALERVNRDHRTVAVSFGQAVAGALTVLLFLLVGRELGWSQSQSRHGGAALAFASPLFTYSGTGWTQPLVTLLLIAATLCCIRATKTNHLRHVGICGAALALACIVRIEYAILSLPLVLGCVTKRRVLSLLVMLGALMTGVAVVLGWNHYFLGAVLPGSSLRLLNNNLAEGLAGLIFSPKAGLIFYAPLILLAPLGSRSLFSAARRMTLVIGALIALHLVFYGMWYQWHASTAWGPRYLLPCVPLLLILATGAIGDNPRRERWYRVLTLLGVLSQLPGILVAGLRLPSGYGEIGPWSPLSYLGGWAAILYGVDCRSITQWSYRVATLVSVLVAFFFWRRNPVQPTTGEHE